MSSYGFNVISYQMSATASTPDPFQAIFPKMTKCTLETYGPSGTLQNLDGLCILPINVLNEKLFFIMWLVFLPLALLTLVEQIFWFTVITSKHLRKKMLCGFVLKTNFEARVRLGNILDSLPFSDWLVLYLMARNIDRALFTRLAEVIHRPGAGYYPAEEAED